MTADITFHYPPELFNLLVDTVPRCIRSKKHVLLFFRGAGVSGDLIDDLAERLETAPSEVKQIRSGRAPSSMPCARGRQRSGKGATCFAASSNSQISTRVGRATNSRPRTRLASIREVVNQKDAFTRINQEREQERQQRLAQADETTRARRVRITKIETAKNEFYALFGSSLTRQARGKKLETALNNLFAAYDILVHEAFHIVGECGEGIVEQIDGVVELKNNLHFVEMKWYEAPVGGRNRRASCASDQPCRSARHFHFGQRLHGPCNPDRARIPSAQSHCPREPSGDRALA